jgi:hypothetical protein
MAEFKIIYGDHQSDLSTEDISSKEKLKLAILRAMSNAKDTKEVLQTAEQMEELFQQAKRAEEEHQKKVELVKGYWGDIVTLMHKWNATVRSCNGDEEKLMAINATDEEKQLTIDIDDLWQKIKDLGMDKRLLQNLPRPKEVKDWLKNINLHAKLHKKTLGKR